MARNILSGLVSAAFAALIAGVLAPESVRGQGQVRRTPEQEAERQRDLVRNFELNARTLTLFDRTGKQIRTIGERGFWGDPSISHDGTRAAVIKDDPQTETNDVWVFDLATGMATKVTATKSGEGVGEPQWSPDGRYLAYTALRGSHFGIYRTLASGKGEEELVYRSPGLPMTLLDWSADGRSLSFFTSDLTATTVYVLPFAGDNQPVEVARAGQQLRLAAPQLSPDHRLLAYRTNESGRNELMVKSITMPATTGVPAGAWRVSTAGATGIISWRRDGRELYYLAPDRGVFAVSIAVGKDVQVGQPRRLFTAPDAIPIGGNPTVLIGVSGEGDRMLVALPPAPQLRQITLFDRAGAIVKRVGEPGLFVQPSMAPDGSKVAVMKQQGVSGATDIWVFDVASGKVTDVTADEHPENAPIWFDAQRIAYASTRGSYAAVYRKAATGNGPEEMLFRYTPGAGMVLTDVSADGQFLVFDGGGIVSVAPLRGTDPLKRGAVDFARSEFELGHGRFSHDGKFVAYLSNEIGNRVEVFVQRFDPSTGAAASDEKWQVTRDGALGGVYWRRDGRELYYLKQDSETAQVSVVAVSIETTPTFKPGASRVLFTLPGPLPGNPRQWKYVTPDGERFVFAMPVK